VLLSGRSGVRITSRT